MENVSGGSYPKKRWVNISFFAVTGLVTLVGAPLYIMRCGIPPAETIALTVFYMVATGMSITGGYHRLFAHATYKAHPVVQSFFLFFGAAAFEQSALEWSSQHRDHHRYVDTDQDPYSIKKGFFYAHMGWLMFWKHPAHYENAQDLQKNSVLMHQNKYYRLWASLSGIILPVLIGAMWGDALGAFVFAVCTRLVFVYQSTFCINSVCHMFGKATYDIYSTAKDHWLIALVTNGEGYHNFHHRFPSDYRNAVRWYQWDPTKWLIAVLSVFGLTEDLKKISNFRILEARLKADQQRVRDWLASGKEETRFQHLSADLEARFKVLLQRLSDWEIKSHAYRDLLRDKIREQSSEIQTFAQAQMRAAREHFELERAQWLQTVQSQSDSAGVL